MYELNEPTLLILIGIIGLIILLIFFIVSNRKYNKIKIIKTNNPDEFKNFMEANNFPEEIIEHMTETTNNISRNTNYCPNCGAKVENPANTTCPYCNTNFTITK